MRNWILIFSLFLLGSPSVHAELIGSHINYQAGDVDLKGYIAYDNSSDEQMDYPVKIKKILISNFSSQVLSLIL